MRSQVFFRLACSAVLLLAAPRLHAQNLAARRITSASDLLQGKGALGKVGDYLLANDKMRVIIDNVGKRQGFAEGGGNIVDAARQGVEVDLMAHLFTYFDNTFPRQAGYDRIEILKDGSDGQEARIRVSGVELRDAKIKVSTEYSIRPGEAFVLVETTLINTGAETLKDFELGDAVQWGYTEHFAPGVGYSLAGRTLTNVEWLAAPGDGVSYGYAASSGTIFGPSGSNWTDANVAIANPAPNAPVKYSRYLIVGTGDIASVTDQVYAIRKQSVGTLTGSVIEEGTRALVSQADISVQTRDGKPFNLIRPARDGTFRAQFPPGDYVLVASAIGRATPAPAFVTIREDASVSASVFVGQPGRFRFTILDRRVKKQVPGKITFEGLGSTPDPYLGPGYQAHGAMNVVFTHTGSGETPIPPGYYEVTVSRGIEYSTWRKRVAVAAGKTTGISAVIERVVDTTGYIAGDFHLHSEYSADSNVTVRDRVIDLVAEGLEFAVSTEHDNLADYKSAIRELRLEKELKSAIGDEVTASGLIHLSAFPLAPNSKQPRSTVTDPAKLGVKDMIDAVRRNMGAEVVQVNHPRAGNMGYFTTAGFNSKAMKAADPAFTLDFDAIEVCNGKHLQEALDVLRDWFNLLNAGYRITGTGNSDSHSLVTDEPGYPRNFILLGKDDPESVTDEEVVAAVKAHKIIVSNGPFPTVAVDGKYTVGDHISVSPGKPLRFAVKLQAAPWVDISEVSLWANGVEAASRLIEESARVDRGALTFEVAPKVDTWYVIVVRGNKALAPVVPDMEEREVLPFAFTNPVWVDADGDGRFTPPNQRK